jgi:hypothetical protein
MSETTCTYCGRPARTPILAADKPFCRTLCAGLGMLRQFTDEVDANSGFSSIAYLAKDATESETPMVPIVLRDEDAVEYLDEHASPNEYLLGVSDDTPDEYLDFVGHAIPCTDECCCPTQGMAVQ